MAVIDQDFKLLHELSKRTIRQNEGVWTTWNKHERIGISLCMLGVFLGVLPIIPNLFSPHIFPFLFFTGVFIYFPGAFMVALQNRNGRKSSALLAMRILRMSVLAVMLIYFMKIAPPGG